MADDSTYRFDPAEFREGGETDAGESPAEVAEGDSTTPEATGTAGAAGTKDARPGEGREFGWRGWTLVGMLFVALVVVPTLLYFVPRAQWLAASFGLGYRDAFLVLPLVPALVLAALAVWATTRP